MTRDIPLYKHVYNKLKDSIINGEYTINSKLPSETDLQKNFDVSRITIRRAVEMLQTEGYVEKYPGVGTIVEDNRQVIKIRNTSGFRKDNMKYNPKSKLIKFKKVIAPLEIQSRLELEPNAYVYKIVRLRFIDDNAVGLHTSYVPTSVIKLKQSDFLSENSSLYSLFAQNNIQINSADEVTDVKQGSEKVNKLLGISEKLALLCINRTTYNENETPIEYVDIYYRTDKFKYQTKFRANH